MKKSEVKEIAKDVSLVFKEFFSKATYYPLIEKELSELESLYGEVLHNSKTYGDPIDLGYIKPDFNPNSNSFRESYGYKETYRGSIEVPVHNLNLKGLELDSKKLQKSKIEYLGRQFSVLDVVPSMPLGDTFLVYSFILGELINE